MNLKIAFFGSDDFTLPVLQKIFHHGVNLVITNNPHGEIAKFCKDNAVEILITNLKDENSKNRIQNSNVDIAILASYGAIIPESIINSFKFGIINIHPSLLPTYKGPTPVPTTLLNGDTQTGVTLIFLDKEVDHGPIISQKPYQLFGNETAEDLLSILFEIGADLVDSVIIRLKNEEKIIGTPQDHSKETWSFKITKQDGYIDILSPKFEISNLTFKIDNMIRAYHPWPGVWLRWERTNGKVQIVKLLPEGKVQLEGKNPMSYKDFLNGFGDEGRELLTKLHLI